MVAGLHVIRCSLLRAGGGSRRRSGWCRESVTKKTGVEVWWRSALGSFAAGWWHRRRRRHRAQRAASAARAHVRQRRREPQQARPPSAAPVAADQLRPQRTVRQSAPILGPRAAAAASAMRTVHSSGASLAAGVASPPGRRRRPPATHHRCCSVEEELWGGEQSSICAANTFLLCLEPKLRAAGRCAAEATLSWCTRQSRRACGKVGPRKGPGRHWRWRCTEKLLAGAGRGDCVRRARRPGPLCGWGPELGVGLGCVCVLHRAQPPPAGRTRNTGPRHPSLPPPPLC